MRAQTIHDLNDGPVGLAVHKDETAHDRAPTWLYGRNVDLVELEESLKPLVERIKQYDALRLRLERRGGTVGDLKSISRLLATPLRIHTRFEDHRVALTDQRSIVRAIYDIGGDNLKFQVRQLNRLPVYYICRMTSDPWDEFRLIVADVYRSPGYPMIDRRFVKIMRSGHEANYLRLSQLRPALAGLLSARRKGEPRRPDETELDRLLHKAGQYVLHFAWHEDQRLATLAAYHFGLPNFRSAIELLYLCQADLSKLRSVSDELLFDFFRKVYPQGAIASFIKEIPNLDGNHISALPEKTLTLYYQLCRAFSRFLETQVTWGFSKASLPLFKILYANYSRFTLVAPSLRNADSVKAAAERLEHEAREVIMTILTRLCH